MGVGWGFGSCMAYLYNVQRGPTFFGWRSVATASSVVVCFIEDGRDSFLTPYFVPSPFRTRLEVFIALRAVAIDGGLACVHRLVIAVVNNRSGHAAEYGLDDIEKGGRCRLAPLAAGARRPTRRGRVF